nr:MAG TPA: hypothetical protein [Caudoviricetes sp.]
MTIAYKCDTLRKQCGERSGPETKGPGCTAEQRRSRIEF